MDENSSPLSSGFYSEDNENAIYYDKEEGDEPLVKSRSYGSHFNRRRQKTKMYVFVFVAFGVLGTIPWNFFINANEFWEYKFRDVNHTDPVDPTHRNDLQSKFESFLSIASQVPALVGSIACTLLSAKFKTHYRIMVPMVLVLLLFSAVIGVSELNTDTWQLDFMLFVLGIVAVINGLMSYGQSSLMGFAGTINSKFMNAMMVGQATGGILASVARILTLFFKGTIIEASRYYFIFALAIIFVTVVMFFMLARTNFYAFYIQKIDDGKLLINDEDRPSSQHVWSILKQIKLYVVSIIIVFVTTLAIFPSVASLVVSVNHYSGSIWTGKLFVPVACFLLFNVGDFVGRFLANWVTLIKEKSVSLLIISVLRLSFIPLILLCNAQPRHILPVAFQNDWIFIVFMKLFAVSNGYLASVSMIYAPRLFIEVADQEKASVLMALAMVSGIALGSVLSVCLVWLL